MSNTNQAMNEKTIAKLRKFFSGLDRDLPLDLAYALAERIGTTPEVILTQYEAWQIA
jgi:hypothetical protein